MSETHVTVSIPLDDDGFLRRSCPSCKRELKWLPSENSEPVPAGGYACPYCGERAGPDGWFTEAQSEFVVGTAGDELLGPILDRFASTPGFKVTREGPPAPLSEPNDMRRVDFDCHPKEPVKVLDDWTGPVRCLICGQA
jgi:hypothetical protein